jgi:hypothetical protein
MEQVFIYICMPIVTNSEFFFLAQLFSFFKKNRKIGISFPKAEFLRMLEKRIWEGYPAKLFLSFFIRLQKLWPNKIVLFLSSKAQPKNAISPPPSSKFKKAFIFHLQTTKNNNSALSLLCVDYMLYVLCFVFHLHR